MENAGGEDEVRRVIAGAGDDEELPVVHQRDVHRVDRAAVRQRAPDSRGARGRRHLNEEPRRALFVAVGMRAARRLRLRERGDGEEERGDCESAAHELPPIDWMTPIIASNMSYTVREVAAMSGLTPRHVRAYAPKGFLEPERGNRGELRFGFRDLIILRTAGELVAAQIPQRKVQRALERLREQLPQGRSLAGVRISADGERVVVRDGGAVWHPESGQSLFDFGVEEIEAKAPPVDYVIESEHEREADARHDVGCDLETTAPDEARGAYQRAIDVDPDHSDAHVNLGRMLHEEGAPLAAQQHDRCALETDPSHPTAAFNLGVALEDLGRMNEARNAYLRAIELDAENADAHYNLAGLYERRGDKAAALRHLKEYRRLKSSRRRLGGW